MIKVAKLVSGEFVIGSMMELNLTNVMLIRFNIDQKSGIINRTLLPYMSPLSDSLGKLITSDKIMAFDIAPQELQIQYLQYMQTFLQNVKGVIDKDGEKNIGQNGVYGENKEETEKTPGQFNISK